MTVGASASPRCRWVKSRVCMTTSFGGRVYCYRSDGSLHLGVDRFNGTMRGGLGLLEEALLGRLGRAVQRGD